MKLEWCTLIAVTLGYHFCCIYFKEIMDKCLRAVCILLYELLCSHRVGGRVTYEIHIYVMVSRHLISLLSINNDPIISTHSVIKK